MFKEGHLVSISVISFSNLTFGFRGEDVYLFLYMYIKENGPAPVSHVIRWIKFV